MFGKIFIYHILKFQFHLVWLTLLFDKLLLKRICLEYNWTGLLVEANPMDYEKGLEKNRKGKLKKKSFNNNKYGS